MQKVRIQTRHSLTRLVSVAMLSAVARVLYLLEFPLLPAATYLKMDFSDIPAVFGGVLFGPAYGVLIELIKNLLEMLLKGFGTQMGFGNLQNFLVGCAYTLPFTILYRMMERREWNRVKGLILACVSGVAVMLVVGFFSNLAVAPLFFRFFLNNPLTPAAAMAAATISLPFNALKSVILSVILAPLLPLALPPVRRALGRLS